jgi:hypothetical protein
MQSASRTSQQIAAITKLTKFMKLKPNQLVKSGLISLLYKPKNKYRFVTEPPVGGLANMNDLQQSNNHQATQPNVQV